MSKTILYTASVVLLAGIVYSIAAWNSPTLIETAEKSLAAGDNEAAIRAFRLHLVRFPEATDIRLKLAGLMASTGPAEAVEHLRLIPEGDSSYDDALRQIAVICLQADQHQAAEEALLRLEVCDANDFAVQLSLAELYFHQENYKSALPRAVHAATLQPDRAETWLLVAEIRDGLRQKPEMIAPLQKAIELAPDLYEAHLNLAYAYHAAGQLDEAAHEARWCLKRNPKEVFAYRILASVARNEGQFEEAATQIEKALALAPRDVDCRILEADLLLYHRKPDEAYRRLKELHDEHKETYRYLGSLARAAAAAGHLDEARQLHVALDNLRSEANRMIPHVTPERLSQE
ncbi:MAG: tetratricopeptide repeat protein [Rhodopirellula sp.]|nr:tetratricopeptide repeat protein [Rhodopirellula sp.]